MLVLLLACNGSGGKKGVNYDVTRSGSFPPDIAPVTPPYPWHPPPGR